MSATTEKKPLLIQIPGEITPNVLPVSASAVGYDFVQGNYIYYATGSDSWVTAPPNGGSGSSPEYWFSTGSNETYTTGSVLIRAGLAASPTPSLVQFDVSGSDYFTGHFDSGPGSYIQVKNVPVAAPDYESSSGSLYLVAANVAASGSGGGIYIKSGKGGYISGSAPNDGNSGGPMSISSGDGGRNIDATVDANNGPGVGGLGGNLDIFAGMGGEGWSGGGSGGNIFINAGGSGAPALNNISELANGYEGGGVDISAGTGGTSQYSGTPGNGGIIVIRGGSPGYDLNTLEEGVAGSVNIWGGQVELVSSSLNASVLMFGGADIAKTTKFRHVSFNKVDTENYGDIFFFVSGAVGAKGTSERGVAVFAGDTVVSGVLYAEKGLSGSLTKLTDDSSYLIAGSGIGISTGSNGAVTISATGGSGLATGKQYVASATTTTTTTPLMIGQFSWVPADYTGLTSITVRAIMSTDGTANHTGSLQIYNLTSGSYLDLVDTPSTGKHFTVTGSTPTLVTSSNLLTGITNFDNSSTSVYEVRVSGSTANNTIIGGVELIFS